MTLATLYSVRPRARSALPLILASALGFVPLPSSAAALRQDVPQVKLTEHAQFRVRVESEAMPVPLRRIHAWRIHITDASGLPLSQAVVRVTGGMPEHRHGLPTQPRVTESATAGDYVMSGVRFSMKGRWVLNLQIRASDGRSDAVTFSFVL